MDRPKPTLDYSCPADEQTREADALAERREKVEAYNDATFGDRRPIRADVLRLVAFALVVGLVVWFVPRKLRWPLTTLLIAGFAVWDTWRSGRPPGNGLSDRPSRWW